MTDQTRKVFMPFTLDEFRAFTAHLLTLTEDIAAVDSALPPEHQALAQRLHDEVQALQGNTTLLLALVRELVAYNLKLTAQRQSARQAYEAGWEARLQDILSQMHPADDQMLRWILAHLASSESPDVEPF